MANDDTKWKPLSKIMVEIHNFFNYTVVILRTALLDEKKNELNFFQHKGWEDHFEMKMLALQKFLSL